MGMTGEDWVVIFNLFAGIIAFLAATVYLASGLQDLFYDVMSYWWRLYKRVAFRNRQRLSLKMLRSREQQYIAVIIPAWNEGEVVGEMVKNIIERVEYKNYQIFVGTYPNDQRTQDAVDRLARKHPEIIKVVTARPGPTSKADCLNNVYQALEAYERKYGVHFDLIVMHDAEDVVHPQSFLLYNYLIPRVDAIQIPVLPLPTPHDHWVHWVYADEFSENHMKDVLVRERVSGFVPFAGTGTGFSRRTFEMLQFKYGKEIFKDGALTEDYSLARKITEMGLKIIFVNVLLADDKSPWWTPLCRRPMFIANWAYFPMDFTRSVRQKTRWIYGISLQEAEISGWKGDIKIKENLIKDRKGFIGSAANFIGYFAFIYFIIFELSRRGYIDLELSPIIYYGTPLYYMVVAVTVIMVIRFLQRIAMVGMVYGLAAGLMSIPRLFVGNVINGIAAFRALQMLANNRQGRKQAKWDATVHMEGVGAMPTTHEIEPPRARVREMIPFKQLVEKLNSPSPEEVMDALEMVPADPPLQERREYLYVISKLALGSEDAAIRAATARISGFLKWPELAPALMRLIYDPSWPVRSNAATAILKYPDFHLMVEIVFQSEDSYAKEVLMKSLEQNIDAQDKLTKYLETNDLPYTRVTLLERSSLLTEGPKRILEPEARQA